MNSDDVLVYIHPNLQISTQPIGTIGVTRVNLGALWRALQRAFRDDSKNMSERTLDMLMLVYCVREVHDWYILNNFQRGFAIVNATEKENARMQLVSRVVW